MAFGAGTRGASEESLRPSVGGRDGCGPPGLVSACDVLEIPRSAKPASLGMTELWREVNEGVRPHHHPPHRLRPRRRDGRRDEGRPPEPGAAGASGGPLARDRATGRPGGGLRSRPDRSVLSRRDDPPGRRRSRRRYGASADGGATGAAFFRRPGQRGRHQVDGAGRTPWPGDIVLPARSAGALAAQGERRFPRPRPLRPGGGPPGQRGCPAGSGHTLRGPRPATSERPDPDGGRPAGRGRIR